MHIALKVICLLFAAFSILATLLLAWQVGEMRQIAFNDQGRYFDADKALVYHEQALEAYAFLLVVGLLLSIFFTYFGLRKRKGTSAG